MATVRAQGTVPRSLEDRLDSIEEKIADRQELIDKRFEIILDELQAAKEERAELKKDTHSIISFLTRVFGERGVPFELPE